MKPMPARRNHGPTQYVRAEQGHHGDSLPTVEPVAGSKEDPNGAGNLDLKTTMISLMPCPNCSGPGKKGESLRTWIAHSLHDRHRVRVGTITVAEQTGDF
ncbi:hypothetical protein LuPra_06079 [Luteitalea pratensis]|uniref:Uncharacterized protein n=1 Tax=Luteitalea pratensis TaxID=1855912 RepID=A0A143PVL8_LUTPR|nr:hypothetical protein LuPra_06079 [Luteitalea pratensis]